MSYEETKAEVLDWLLPPSPGQRFHVVSANYDDHLVVQSVGSDYLDPRVNCLEESSGRMVTWQSLEEWRMDRLHGCITHADLRPS